VSRKKNKDTKERWCFHKAQQYRNSWRARCKKIEGDLESVPTRPEIQEWLMKQEPFRCYITGEYLNKRTLQADHIQPLSRGGLFTLDNVGLTSKRFNQIKGNMTLEEFKQLLSLVSNWEDNGAELFKRLLSSTNIYRR